MSNVPAANRHFTTTLIPIEETISWKVHDVSHLLKTNSWSALSVPLEIGLGPTDLTRWTISLVRHDSALCARATLLSPTDGRRVTHHVKAAVLVDNNPVYYFSNRTNNRITNNDYNNRNTRCTPFIALRNLLNTRLSFTGNLDEGETGGSREASFGGDPTLWKIVPMNKLAYDEEEDSLELVLVVTVFGCDVSER